MVGGFWSGISLGNFWEFFGNSIGILWELAELKISVFFASFLFKSVTIYGIPRRMGWNFDHNILISSKNLGGYKIMRNTVPSMKTKQRKLCGKNLCLKNCENVWWAWPLIVILPSFVSKWVTRGPNELLNSAQPNWEKNKTEESGSNLKRLQVFVICIIFASFFYQPLCF